MRLFKCNYTSVQINAWMFYDINLTSEWIVVQWWTIWPYTIIWIVMAHLYYAYPYPGQQMALHMYRRCDKSYLLLIGLEINEPWEEISPFSYAHRWAIKLSLLPSHSLYCWYKIMVWWQVIEYKLSVYSDMWQGSRIQGLRFEGWKERKSNQSCEVLVISREAKALKRTHP